MNRQRLHPMKPTTLVFLLAFTAACVNRPALQVGGDNRTPSPVTAENSGAQPAAQGFYAEMRRERISGLPNDAQLKRLAPYLTPELVSAFKNAGKEQAEYMRKNPDDKGPWVEGDLFSSLFEGVESWKVGTAMIKGSTAEVPVQLSYRGDSKETVNWSDTLVLKQTSAGWRVADIRMGGKWAFKAGGNSLSSTLSAKP